MFGLGATPAPAPAPITPKQKSTSLFQTYKPRTSLSTILGITTSKPVIAAPTVYRPSVSFGGGSSTEAAVDAGVSDAGVTPADAPPPVTVYPADAPPPVCYDANRQPIPCNGEEGGFPWLLVVGGAVVLVGGYFVVRKLMK